MTAPRLSSSWADKAWYLAFSSGDTLISILAVLRSRSVRMVAMPDILKANAALAFLVSLAIEIISCVVNRLMGLALVVLLLPCQDVLSG